MHLNKMFCRQDFLYSSSYIHAVLWCIGLNDIAASWPCIVSEKFQWFLSTCENVCSLAHPRYFSAALNFVNVFFFYFLSGNITIASLFYGEHSQYYVGGRENTFVCCRNTSRWQHVYTCLLSCSIYVLPIFFKS